MKYFVQVDGEEFEVEILEDGRVLLAGQPVHADLVQVHEDLYSLLMDHASYELMVERGEKGYRVLLGGVLYNVQVEDERRRRLLAGRSKPAAPVGDMHVKAPIPGLIVKVEVEVGQHVRADQPLVILEAMKMENEIRAPQAGIVREVRVSPGDSVEQGAVLVVLG